MAVLGRWPIDLGLAGSSDDYMAMGLFAPAINDAGRVDIAGARTDRVVIAGPGTDRASLAGPRTDRSVVAL